MRRLWAVHSAAAPSTGYESSYNTPSGQAESKKYTANIRWSALLLTLSPPR